MAIENLIQETLKALISVVSNACIAILIDSRTVMGSHLAYYASMMKTEHAVHLYTAGPSQGTKRQFARHCKNKKANYFSLFGRA